jgi:hypothetical protein
VEFRVLGGLEVVGSEGPIELRGAKRRALVGLLLAEQGRTVPADRVVRHLWLDERAGRVSSCTLSRYRFRADDVPPASGSRMILTISVSLVV